MTAVSDMPFSYSVEAIQSCYDITPLYQVTPERIVAEIMVIYQEAAGDNLLEQLLSSF
jgi:hypothetical protein